MHAHYLCHHIIWSFCLKNNNNNNGKIHSYVLLHCAISAFDNNLGANKRSHVCAWLEKNRHISEQL